MGGTSATRAVLGSAELCLWIEDAMDRAGRLRAGFAASAAYRRLSAWDAAGHIGQKFADHWLDHSARAIIRDCVARLPPEAPGYYLAPHTSTAVIPRAAPLFHYSLALWGRRCACEGGDCWSPSAAACCGPGASALWEAAAPGGAIFAELPPLHLATLAGGVARGALPPPSDLPRGRPFEFAVFYARPAEPGDGGAEDPHGAGPWDAAGGDGGPEDPPGAVARDAAGGGCLEFLCGDCYARELSDLRGFSRAWDLDGVPPTRDLRIYPPAAWVTRCSRVPRRGPVVWAPCGAPTSPAPVSPPGLLAAERLARPPAWNWIRDSRVDPGTGVTVHGFVRPAREPWRLVRDGSSGGQRAGPAPA